MKNGIKANDNKRTVLFMISNPFNDWQKMKSCILESLRRLLITIKEFEISAPLIA